MTTVMSSSADLREALTRLVSRPADVQGAPRPERPRAVGAIVGEVRALLGRFEALEAAHVATGLADASFPFDAAQADLVARRRDFAVVVHDVGDGLSTLLAPAEHAELRRIATLAHAAPPTSRADLEAIRAARSARPR